MAAGYAALVGGVCCNNFGSLAKFDAMRIPDISPTKVERSFSVFA